MLLQRGEAVRSLSTCSVNLHPSCDFHMSQKWRDYLQAWQHPAPSHCATPPSTTTATPLLMNHLGINSFCQAEQRT